jgi:hypothetical protein
MMETETSSGPAHLSDEDVIEAMHRYGGSFVEALAIAARRADRENLARLRLAFPDVWRRYAEIARLKIETGR